MAAKTFRARFYCGAAFDAPGHQPVSEVLSALAAAQAAGTTLPQHAGFELREFVSLNDGAAFRGVLAVLRDDAPHIREAGGDERAIALEEDEYVIEKNHFLYFKQNELLVWQVNGAEVT